MDCLWEESGLSSRDVGQMTRREVAWRLDLAAEKRKRRGIVSHASPPIDSNPEFTVKEKKILDSALLEAQARVRDRFKKTP